MGDCDRVSKVSAECKQNEGDRRNKATWETAFASKRLVEFNQHEYTCENSYGWSRIDRAYTSMHTADVKSMRTA
eukprot:9683158-Karenia_brevis.AAC.1